MSQLLRCIVSFGFVLFYLFFFSNGKSWEETREKRELRDWDEEQISSAIQFTDTITISILEQTFSLCVSFVSDIKLLLWL